MKEQFRQLKDEAIGKLNSIFIPEELESFRIEFLGRKGRLAELFKKLGTLSDRERREAGQTANLVKQEIEKAYQEKTASLSSAKRGNLAETEWIDVTEPGTKPLEGHSHLVSQTIREIVSIFEKIGFQRRSYREIDSDWYAFESLNMPKNHPARDEWETFYIDSKKGDVVLTPHTSNGQVKEMERKELPIRMINIARCYRRQIDISHVPMLHQFEGLMVDKGISIAHLKGVMEYFVREFFCPERKIRLRPFHFQFTEPSFEIDISCSVCGGKGCRLCKEGWLELAGAGMVHPNVLRAGGINPKKYNGFAFGWGVERACMMKPDLGIDDIRIFYQNDLRFLRQF